MLLLLQNLKKKKKKKKQHKLPNISIIYNTLLKIISQIQHNSRKEDFFIYLLLFSSGLMYRCLNGAIPQKKCSIKVPAKRQRSSNKEVNNWTY